MTIIDKSFTAIGVGISLLIKSGQSFTYSLSGTFSGTAILERSLNGGQTWDALLTKTVAASGRIDVNLANGGSAIYRWVCSAYTSGTLVTEVKDIDASAHYKMIPAAIGKAGTTSGWVPANADNLSLATCPASKTASTLVVPITGLKTGDILQGAHLAGELTSVGGAVTVDMQIRMGVSAAGSITDSLLGSISQIALSASAIINAANSLLAGLNHTVAAGQHFYALITATTAASTSIALQSVVAIVDEA